MGIAVGVDFGTTNSVVTYVEPNKKPRTYKPIGSPLIPSVIYFKTRDDYCIGQKAVAMSAKNFAGAISGFKTKLNEDDTPYVLTLEDGSTFKIRPKFVVKLFLNKLLGDVQEYLLKKKDVDATIDRAVITVPTKFKDTANAAIKTAASAAMQLSVGQIKLVYEPTAAAIAAQQDEDSDASRLLIYDFGGGTFDVSLIQKDDGVFKQVNTDGDPKCGGNLLTNILARNLLEWANAEYGTNFPWDVDDFDEDVHGISESKYRANLAAIVREADYAKISLSEEDDTSVTFPFWISDDDSENYIVDVSRKDFEHMIREQIDHTAKITQRVIDSAEAKEVGGIDKIIIAGGSGQIPMIRQILQDRFGNLPINRSEDVSTLISRGAAILANDIKTLEENILQKTTVQLGISSTEGMGYGIFQTIIDAGLTLPCENSCNFRLMEDGQRRLKIFYYDRDKKNYPHATRIDDEGITQVTALEMELPPGLKKADTVVTVTFSVQKDSTLEISAQVFTGNGQAVTSNKIKVNKGSDTF